MEEVDDATPYPIEEVPVPPELKRSENSMREKVECPDCGKRVSKHTLQYGSHKKTCKGKKQGTVNKEKLLEAATPIVENPEETEEPEILEEEKKPKPKEKKPKPVKEEKPALTRKQVEKPLKQKQVIQRTPEPEPVFFAPRKNWYEEMVMLRNQQAMQRNEAMLAPYRALMQARRGL